MLIDTQERSYYEDAVAAAMGIDMPDGGLTVGQVLEHAINARERPSSYFPESA